MRLFHWRRGLPVLLLVALTARAHAGVISDGVDDLMTTGQLGSVFFTSTGATIAFWVRTTGTAPAVDHAYEGQSIVGDALNYYGIYRQNNTGAGDMVTCWSYLTNSEDVGTTTNNTVWTHIAFVQTATALTCYKNGLAAGSNTASTALDLSNSGTLVFFSVVSGGVTTYAGEITDVRLFNTALTASQIEVIALSRQFYSGPMNGTGTWTFSQCGDGAAANGVVFADRSGSNRTLTADDGANNSGVICAGSSHLSWPVGAQ